MEISGHPPVIIAVKGKLVEVSAGEDEGLAVGQGYEILRPNRFYFGHGDYLTVGEATVVARVQIRAVERTTAIGEVVSSEEAVRNGDLLGQRVTPLTAVGAGEEKKLKE